MNETRGPRGSSVPSFMGRHRLALQAAADAGVWMFALSFSTLLRLEFALVWVTWSDVFAIGCVFALAQMIAGHIFGLYTGRWRYGSFEEVAALTGAAAVTTTAALVVNLAAPAQFVPYTAIVGAGILAFTLMAGARFAWRSKVDRQRRPRGTTSRLLILGAGEATATLLAALLSTPASPYLPVALLDDDPAKRKLRIRGVPVVGTSADIAAAASMYHADTLLIAITAAQADLIRSVTEAAEAAGLAVKVLPPVSELIDQKVAVADIRPVTIADLLGRREIDTDLTAIARYLTGRRVLVTGAGGSIGSELCRQIHRFAPEELIMLDRDESALHAVQLSIEGRALLESGNLVLADIRDGERIHRVFQEHRPQVVFHAAALKHLTLLERQPEEALKTNVLGTLTVLQAAAAAGVERLVNISTDKAADPSSVLGSSKRIGERLTSHLATEASGTYLSVRFGNVLGSRGSMLVTFQAQVRSGGPITVTHPEVTRYFMTVEEAVQLTIQAGAIGCDGEVLVLDMGAPVRIADVAERLAGDAQRPIEIVYTGLRPGEKLHEVLVSREERGAKRGHALIRHIDVPPLHPRDVQHAHWFRSGAISERLAELCTYRLLGTEKVEDRA